MSTWAETALMLTAAEIPGIYLRPDDGTLLVFDQIEAEITCFDASRFEIQIHNPGSAEARVRVFSENRRQALEPLTDSALCQWPVETLAPGATRTLHWNTP
jgi:hypothetical protein